VEQDLVILAFALHNEAHILASKDRFLSFSYTTTAV
jgi:hypothetical protein